MGEASSATSGPCVGPHTIGTRLKGLRRVKSDRRHRRKTNESYERETYRRPSRGQKGYRDRKSRPIRRTDVDQPVEPRGGSKTKIYNICEYITFGDYV